jgi:hypothetical protein
MRFVTIWIIWRPADTLEVYKRALSSSANFDSIEGRAVIF